VPVTKARGSKNARIPFAGIFSPYELLSGVCLNGGLSRTILSLYPIPTAKQLPFFILHQHPVLSATDLTTKCSLHLNKNKKKLQLLFQSGASP